MWNIQQVLLKSPVNHPKPVHKSVHAIRVRVSAYCLLSCPSHARYPSLIRRRNTHGTHRCCRSAGKKTTKNYILLDVLRRPGKHQARAVLAVAYGSTYRRTSTSRTITVRPRARLMDYSARHRQAVASEATQRGQNDSARCRAAVAAGHGIRVTPSTALNEQGYYKKWIELQLSHIDPNQVPAAYNHAAHAEQRRR